MELTNEFRVGVPPAQAWKTLTDVELIAPCLPGAQLTEVEGDEYRGTVKVKVGPITAQYKGTATFVEKDEDNLKAVLDAKGRDTRGAGNASATVTAQLTPDGDGTKVVVHTDLKVTGKVAQFGRGVLADVSTKLLEQFVECLETKVLAGGAGGEAEAGPSTDTPPATAAPSTGPRRIESPEAEPVDLGSVAGAPVLKRLAPVLVVLLVLFFLRRRRRG
jgi:uncharacterized protein